MKIGLIGNMNNNHFAMARYLRDRGFDATVLLTDHEYPNFHPSADCIDGSYGRLCRQLAWGSAQSLRQVGSQQMAEDLRDFEVLVGCGLAPACCERAGRRLDVFIPYGGDLWEATMFRPCRPRNLVISWGAALAQRRGIAKVPVVHMSPVIMYERRLARLAPRSERWREGLPMVYHPMYEPGRMDSLLEATPHAKRFQAVRSNCDLMLFSSVRHAWRLHPNNPNAKGTDRLLRALALVRSRRPGLRACLVTMEYGQDVAATKDLAVELGIADMLEWFPTMARRELMAGLLLSDAACAEFETSYDSSGVIYEALVAAKPLVMHRTDADYLPTAPPSGLCPALNGREPAEIAERLLWVADHTAEAKSMGERGRTWYAEQVAHRTLDRYETLLRGGGAGA